MFGIIQKADKAAATLSKQSVSATEWSSTHWSHCSQSVLRASHAFWDRKQSGMLFHHFNLYSHMQGSQKSCFPFQKKGVRII